jgi:RNA-dependent RNA polymerase
MLKDLHPPRDRICAPAKYAPPERKCLNRPSDVKDLADFIVEYINSDVR